MPLRTIVFHPDPPSFEAWNGQVQSAGMQIVHSVPNYEHIHLILSKHPCDLILLTLTEEPAAGIAALQEIHQRMPRANLMVYSLQGPNRAVLKVCKELNVIDFLVQPVSLDRLRQAVGKIKVPEEKRERGAVVCVGYTPSHAERTIISNMKLSYLYYPSCHLAIQMFQQRSQKRLIILIIQEDLEMYSSALTKPIDPLQLLDENFMPPWKQVIYEAQIYYQDFWNKGIREGLLPLQIPCLYVPGKGGDPQFLKPEVIETMNIVYVDSRSNYTQITPPGKGTKGEEEAVQEVAKEVNVCLDEVEKRHPELTKASTPAPEPPAFKKPAPKIDKRSIPTEKPPKNAQRMTRRDKEDES